MRDKVWIWKHAKVSYILCLKYKDAAKWTITSSGCYSCAAADNEIRVKELEVEVNWWKFLWFQLAIPRHTFIGWLAIKKNLTIRDKLAKWGYTGDTLCVFCRGCIGSKDHLFFACNFARRIWIFCWTSGSSDTRLLKKTAKDINRKLLFQNIDKLTIYYARHKSLRHTETLFLPLHFSTTWPFTRHTSTYINILTHTSLL